MTWLIALVGGLSLAVVVLAALNLRRARIERRRSDARVAALAAALDGPRWTMPLEDEDPREAPSATSPVVSLVVPDVERPSSRIPAFVGAAVAVLAVGALLVAGLRGGGQPARHARPLTATSIELISMRYALDRETLIVSGLVRNPTTAATAPLSAVVSVIGHEGQVVARGESQLDSVVLGPGKETTFRVSVSDIEDPGRYRVAFVNGSQIVPHVDRRSDLTRTALANDAREN